MPVKVRQALRAGLRLTASPFDYARAIELAEALADWAPIRAGYRRMVQGVSAAEREHLRELTRRPIDLQALHRLPEGTLGHCYAAFMRDNRLSATAPADAWPPMAEVYQRSWVMARYARVHDIHHALLEVPVDPQSELGLQIFGARNFGEPYALLAVASVPITLLRYGETRRCLRAIERGFRWGGQLPNLMVVPFEDMFEMDVAEVRARLGIDLGR